MLGDVICITEAPQGSEAWVGFVKDAHLGQSPTETQTSIKVREKGPKYRSGRYLVDVHHVFRIPTTAQQPDLEFIDEMTPIISFSERI